MTMSSKVVQEIDYKFYSSYDEAVKDNFTFLTVEVDGVIPPQQVIKTIIIDKDKIKSIGPDMASVGVDNLRSARFQLVKIKRFIPMDIDFYEDVYIFESYID